MWINKNGYDFTSTSFEIKKVAMWVEFGNFNVKFNDESTQEVNKVYNKGFFMTPLLDNDAGNSNKPTGFVNSANPYSIVEGGMDKAEWYQLEYDLTDRTEAMSKFSTKYIQFTQTVTLATVTGLEADLNTPLLGAQINDKTVTDFTFTVVYNCVQIIY